MNKTKCIKTIICFFGMLFILVLGMSTEKIKATDYGISNPRISGDTVKWDCIYFGNYYQKNSTTKEPIKWRVLSVNGDDAFILAEQALDCKTYNDTDVSVTWETCTLRSWLNNTFLNNAFNSSEIAAIKTTAVVYNDNPEYGSNSGNATLDKIYLLSVGEVSNPAYGFVSIFDDGISSKTRQTTATKYASVQGAGIGVSPGCIGNTSWWLRSNDVDVDRPINIWVDGARNTSFKNDNHAVRPALHINLSSYLWKMAGTVTSYYEPCVKIIVPESVTVSLRYHTYAIDATVVGGREIYYTSSNNKVLTVKDNGIVTIKRCGKATIKIEALPIEGYLSSSKDMTIIVTPNKTKLKSVKSSGKKRLQVSWKKQKTISGYQMMFSERSDFKRKTYKRTFNKSKTNMNVLGLKSGKTYYVKVRAYKMVGKNKYYGKWSDVKSVKIK